MLKFNTDINPNRALKRWVFSISQILETIGFERPIVDEADLSNLDDLDIVTAGRVWRSIKNTLRDRFEGFDSRIFPWCVIKNILGGRCQDCFYGLRHGCPGERSIWELVKIYFGLRSINPKQIFSEEILRRLEKVAEGNNNLFYEVIEEVKLRVPFDEGPHEGIGGNGSPGAEDVGGGISFNGDEFIRDPVSGEVIGIRADRLGTGCRDQSGDGDIGQRKQHVLLQGDRRIIRRRRG